MKAFIRTLGLGRRKILTSFIFNEQKIRGKYQILQVHPKYIGTCGKIVYHPKLKNNIKIEGEKKNLNACYMKVKPYYLK